MKPLRTVETDSFNRLVTIISHLLNIPFVCTTADLWSSQNKSFLGMTIYWIDHCTLERKSAAIACTRFKGGHTNDNIAAAIYDIHCRYGINGKVYEHAQITAQTW